MCSKQWLLQNMEIVSNEQKPLYETSKIHFTDNLYTI